MPIAIMMVWLTPSMIEGFAMGSWTFRRVWRRVDPNEPETSSAVDGTPRMPRLVSRTAGGSAKISVAMTAARTPIPNSNTSGSR